MIFIATSTTLCSVVTHAGVIVCIGGRLTFDPGLAGRRIASRFGFAGRRRLAAERAFPGPDGGILLALPGLLVWRRLLA